MPVRAKPQAALLSADQTESSEPTVNDQDRPIGWPRVVIGGINDRVGVANGDYVDTAGIASHAFAGAIRRVRVARLLTHRLSGDQRDLIGRRIRDAQAVPHGRRWCARGRGVIRQVLNEDRACTVRWEAHGLPRDTGWADHRHDENTTAMIRIWSPRRPALGRADTRLGCLKKASTMPLRRMDQGVTS